MSVANARLACLGIALAAALVLFGCADASKAIGQGQTSQSVRLCSPLPMRVVEERLSAAWTACYDKVQPAYLAPAGGVLVAMPASRPWRLQRQTDRQGGVSLAFLLQTRPEDVPRHLLDADKGSSASCATTVSVRAYNEPYVAGVQLTEEWLRDDQDPAKRRCK